MVALGFNPSTQRQGRRIMNLRSAGLGSEPVSKNKNVTKQTFKDALYSTRHIKASAFLRVVY